MEGRGGKRPALWWAVAGEASQKAGMGPSLLHKGEETLGQAACCEVKGLETVALRWGTEVSQDLGRWRRPRVLESPVCA